MDEKNRGAFCLLPRVVICLQCSSQSRGDLGSLGVLLALVRDGFC